MNFDICKKCKRGLLNIGFNKESTVGNKYKFFCYIDIDKNFYFEMNREQYEQLNQHINKKSIKIDNDLFFLIYPVFKKSINKDKSIIKLLNNIKLNKTCPYYLEHQLNEWNNK